MISSEWAETLDTLATRAGMLPLDLLRRYTLPELQANAALVRAAREHRRRRLRKSLAGQDAFEAYAVFLEEIALGGA